MARIVDLAAGAEARLPLEVLRVRLLGSLDGVTLTALDEHGTDTTFRRVDATTILIHPARGAATLLARPAAGGAFPATTRVGLGVHLEGAPDGHQVIVAQVDVGALRDHELARVEPVEGTEWVMTALHRGSAALDLQSPTPTTSSDLDERAYPWLVAGRYAVRGARSGAVTEPSGSPWSLLLDASSSMREGITHEALVRVVELIAGIVSEVTGVLPVSAATTGVSAPVPVGSAVEQPAMLAEEMRLTHRPPTWNIVSPAIRDAAELGARVVVLVTDGPPADLRDVSSYLSTRPDVHLVVVVVSRRDAAQAVTGVGAELGALVDLRDASSVTVVTVDPDRVTDARESHLLADALIEVA